MVHTCSKNVSGVNYSHLKCNKLAQLFFFLNCLLVASPVLCCQFQNSTLAVMCEKIKVGFHFLYLTYSQTSYLRISWSIN